MTMQGVVVACGGEKRFGNLVTEDGPRCMLELGFKPMVWYALQTLEKGGVRDVILVAAGEANAAAFAQWIADEIGTGETSSLVVSVVAADEDADTADALRAALPKLTTPTVTVISGDLVTDVRLEDVLATHAKHSAVATCLVARRRPWAAVDAKAGRPPKNAHYIAVAYDAPAASASSAAEGQLLFAGDEEDVDKVLKLRRPMLRRVQRMMIHTDLLDAQLYAFDVAWVSRLLREEPWMTSLQLDVVPALARRQFKPASAEDHDTAAAGAGAGADDDDDAALMKAVYGPAAAGAGPGAPDAATAVRRPCRVFVASEDAYCARVDTVVPAYLEVSREVASPAACDAAHLNGRAPSKYENFVDAGVAVGGKTTIGPGCVVARDVVLGEKCSVKRSVVARGASVGTGVKLVNSVVMPRASVEDGVSLNGCVVGPRAVIGAGSSLRECLVGAEYEVEEGDDVRAETLSSKAR